MVKLQKCINVLGNFYDKMIQQRNKLVIFEVVMFFFHIKIL